MNIIFLDIDGVLNPKFHETFLIGFEKFSDGKVQCKDDNGYYFFEPAIILLTNLVKKTKAKIVISSSWRDSGLQEMKLMWKNRNYHGDIIGITPNIGFHKRGEEIEQYLIENNYKKIVNYVIIDDLSENYFLEEQRDKLVKCNQLYGFTKDDYQKALKILNYNQ